MSRGDGGGAERPELAIPLRELTFSYARSGGAGGQNVNKVATKAVLRWRVRETGSIPSDVRERFVARFASRLTTEGELVLASDRFRDRGRNVADCVERLHAMLAAVATPPRPRKPTRPGRSAKEGRLAAKRAQSQKKRVRGARPSEED